MKFLTLTGTLLGATTLLSLASSALAKPLSPPWTTTSSSIRCTQATKTVTVTVTPTGTSCAPTSVATLTRIIDPPTWPTAGPDYVQGLTFGPGWAHIACQGYCSSFCPEGVPNCDPSCSTKGTCGNSLRTNLYLGNPPALYNPRYTIIPTPPAKSFTIPLIYLTAGSFSNLYTTITFEVRSWDANLLPLPTQSFIIPPPPMGVAATDIRLDLVNLGIANVGKLEFLPYYTGSVGMGHQGPEGRLLAQVKIDGDGWGGVIPYEVYTPQC